VRGWLGALCLVSLCAGHAAAQSEQLRPSDAANTQQPALAPAPEPAPASKAKPKEEPKPKPVEPEAPSLSSRILERIQIHGFVSEGGFISTDNNYIGNSSQGSLKFFEAALNVSATLTDQLRVGIQFVSRSVGYLSEEVPRLDWAVIDYRYRPWVGMRAGAIKMPLGLYNESIGVDAARTSVLLPSSLYPLRNRDALQSHLGFAVYGSVKIGPVGALDYQAWLGALAIPRSALELDGAELDSTDTRYVTGGQLYWRPPVEGLRLGATYLQASIDFHLTLSPANIEQLIAANVVPPDYQGKLLIEQNPARFWVASAEYMFGDWLFAFEYSRWLKHQQTSLPSVLPTLEEDAERFYGMVTYRVTPHFELGSYYSVVHADVDDRRGHGDGFKKKWNAFQRDLAGTLRIDINDYWLWKIEGHFIDGTADLLVSQNPDPTRFWGLFLLRTTVTF
jgi:hypothetical protein